MCFMAFFPVANTVLNVLELCGDHAANANLNGVKCLRCFFYGVNVKPRIGVTSENSEKFEKLLEYELRHFSALGITPSSTRLFVGFVPPTAKFYRHIPTLQQRLSYPYTLLSTETRIF